VQISAGTCIFLSLNFIILRPLLLPIYRLVVVFQHTLLFLKGEWKEDDEWTSQMSTNAELDSTYHRVYSAADDTTEDESDEGSDIDILDTYRLTSTMTNLLNDPGFLVYTPNLKSIINSAKNGSVPVASKILEDDICGSLSFTF
jgi:hypothetical protein